MGYEYKQKLATMKVPVEIRDALKEIAKRETRSMVGQLEYMIKEYNRKLSL